MRSPPEDNPPSTGPPDRQTLLLIKGLLTDEPMVSTAVLEPDSYEPQFLRILFDTGQYPSAIQTARLEIRWFSNGDFSFHYIEKTVANDRWECRWDHHLNTHNDRLHFHQPPEADEVEDLGLESIHPIDVVSTVLASVKQRVTDHWSTEG